MWQAIQYVSTGLTLFAFIVAVAAWVHRNRILSIERRISSAAEQDRAALVEGTLEFFRIDTQALTREQRFQLAVKQIEARAERFRIIAVLVLLLSFIAAGVAVYSTWARTTSIRGGQDNAFFIKTLDKNPPQPNPNTSGLSNSPIYTECLKLLTNDAKTEVSMLNGAYVWMGTNNSGRLLCDKLVDKFPSNSEVMGLHARALTVEGREEEAIAHFERAARLGDMHSCLVLGIYFLQWSIGDRDQGFQYLMRAADRGSLEAELQIGLMYEFGHQELPDYKNAARAYEICVKKGSIEASFRLGQFYQFGLGVPQDVNKARELYRFAAGEGHKMAVKALYEAPK